MQSEVGKPCSVAMGCGASTHISDFDSREGQTLQCRLAAGDDREAARRRFAAAEKQVTKAECFHILPQFVEDNSTDATAESESGISGRTKDSDGAVNSRGPDGFKKTSVQIHVPDHLQQFVKAEPVLKDFVEPAEMKCSWDMPSLREQFGDLPAGIVIAPDRHMHDNYMKHLDRFLAQVSTTPRQFEGEVQVKKLSCGLSPMPQDIANKIKRRKGALEALGLL